MIIETHSQFAIETISHETHVKFADTIILRSFYKQCVGTENYTNKIQIPNCSVARLDCLHIENFKQLCLYAGRIWHFCKHLEAFSQKASKISNNMQLFIVNCIVILVSCPRSDTHTTIMIINMYNSVKLLPCMWRYSKIQASVKCPEKLNIKAILQAVPASFLKLHCIVMP